MKKPCIPTIKTSRRDLAYVLSQKLNGGTTVAGTLIIANMVGIKVFATGGIGKYHSVYISSEILLLILTIFSGGVHRDGENTMDISADLVELGRCPVAVVSSGVKSILDIPRTLEFLVDQIQFNVFSFLKIFIPFIRKHKVSW